MLRSSTVQHLRLGFSLFLMPVYWFALSQATLIHLPDALLIFIILHLLVYPSSNGYNSYMDRDTGSIGGVEKPLPVSRELFLVSLCMDAAAILGAFFISNWVAAGVVLYITASRLYSYRRIRLKKYPVTGYLTVIICQGALVYAIVSLSADSMMPTEQIYLPAIICSLLIGGTYPLTQVYQHEQDRSDGVRTLSYVLGIKGTFVFCAAVLFVALLLLTTYFVITGQQNAVWVYAGCMLPVGVYFTGWFLKVDKDPGNADFKSLMKMNLIASVCSSLAFIIILIINKT